MTDLIDVVQDDGIDDSLVELFEVISPDETTIYYLFNGLEDGIDKIEFRTNDYFSIPIEITGIEMSSTGAAPRPTLNVANIPSLTKSLNSNEKLLQDIKEALNFDTNDDLIGTRIIYHRTLKSNTDNNNATSPEFPPQTFYIDRIASENNIVVSFELASPFDIEGAKLPHRVVIGKYCPWQYQGVELGLGGGCTWPLNNQPFKDLNNKGLYFKSNDDLISRDLNQTSAINAWSSGATYTPTNKVFTTDTVNGYTHTRVWEALFTNSNKDPRTYRKYWKRIDLCSKTLTGCKKRFQGNYSGSTLDQNVPLPFGGFPGSKKFK